MIFVLPGYIAIVNHKHIPVDIRDMSVSDIEVLKCAIDDFIGRYNMVVIAYDIIQIHALFLPAPRQRSQVIAQIVNFFLHYPDRDSVELLIKGAEINIGRKHRLHRQHPVIGLLGIFMSCSFYLSAHQAFL